MLNEYIQSLITPNMIDLIVTGDEKALSEVFKHYGSLIRKNCTRKYCDNNGNSYLYFDEDKEQKLKIHLASAIKNYRF